jgi:hypothetical protein
MTNTLADKSSVPDATVHRWSPASLLQTWLSTRREVRGISTLARRERLRLGFGHVPQRVWDRHSALFIER